MDKIAFQVLNWLGNQVDQMAERAYQVAVWLNIRVEKVDSVSPVLDIQLEVYNLDIP